MEVCWLLKAFGSGAFFSTLEALRLEYQVMRGERRTEMRSLHLSLSAFLLEASKVEMSSKVLD